MLSYKTIFIFIVKCLAIYFVLVLALAPTLKLEESFAKVICKTGNIVLRNTSWKSKAPGNEQAMLVHMKRNIDGESGTANMPIYHFKKPMLYCFLLLLSLLLAMPYLGKKWWRTLGLGMMGMWIYIIIILKLYTIYGVNEIKTGVLVSDSLFGQIFNNTVGHMTIVPLFIWALVSFRRSDLQQSLTLKTKS